MKDFRQEGGCYYYNKIFLHQNETQFNAFMRLLDNLLYGLWYSGVLKCLLASCLTPPPSLKGMINIEKGSILRGHNIIYLKSIFNRKIKKEGCLIFPVLKPGFNILYRWMPVHFLRDI